MNGTPEAGSRRRRFRLAPFAWLPRGWRWVARILTVLLVLVLVAALLVVWTVRRPWPQVDGTIALNGMGSPVTVYRDVNGIPHLYATSAHDLFFAQGYVHAQDRFWEMDFRRHSTAGRLSELFGDATVEVDKVVRTLGWRRVAEQELELLESETRGYLEDYAAGVNVWMREHSGPDAALEYSVLGFTNPGYEPEPWTPVDSLAWLKAMAWDLRANLEDEIARPLAATEVPLDRVEQLWPDYPFDENPPILGAATSPAGVQVAAPDDPAAADPGDPATGAPGAGTAPDDTTPDDTTPQNPADENAAETGTDPAALAPPAVATSPPAPVAGALRATAATLGTLSDLLGGGRGGEGGIGSNSWVVSGDRTATGAPLLANDPHLGPTMPSIWYQAGLHCREISEACPFDVTGFTFSGVPGVVIGHNQRIAWGFTNLGADVTDLYVEQVRDDGTYSFVGEWRPLETRTETIEVAGGEPVQLAVRSTHHGPIVSDVLEDTRDAKEGVPAAVNEPLLPDDQSYHVSLAWTALTPGTTIEALFQLNRAANWDEFRAAAAAFEVPSQNVVYADVEGNIGYQAPGRIPVRARGDGRWPMPGWTGEFEWTDEIPFEELPSDLNPEAGYIVTANQPVTGPESPESPALSAAPEPPAFLTADWNYGYRARLINERLQDATDLDLDRMSQIQNDTHSLLAEVLVPYLLDVPLSEPVSEAQSLLAGWDGEQGPGSAPAAYFNAVWRHLLVRAFNDELPEGARPTGGSRWHFVVSQLLEAPDDPWWDDVGTGDRAETRDDILAQALLLAHEELAAELGTDVTEWDWGDLHTLELANQSFGTSGIELVERLFNRGPLNLGGSFEAIDATSWDTQDGYEVTAVPSMRMVVDLGDLDASRWVNLTGASGHAFAPNYDDQARVWAVGQTTPMQSSEDRVRQDATHTLILEPS